MEISINERARGPQRLPLLICAVYRASLLAVCCVSQSHVRWPLEGSDPYLRVALKAILHNCAFELSCEI